MSPTLSSVWRHESSEAVLARAKSAASSFETVMGLESEAHWLVEQLPDLLVEAKRVSHTVAHGIHGRRRAGPGETFWQFRPFQQGDSAGQIDWRRSAGSDHLFVREQEWEAAHTVWLWADLSPSMDFHSHLTQVTKRARALVLFFAIGELLARGGERVGLLGGAPARLGRNVVQRLVEEIANRHMSASAETSLPPEAHLSRFSECVLVSDFLEPIEDLKESLNRLAGQGVGGHLVQILDPAEETLPYEGRTEFFSLESNETMLANRAEALREAYTERLFEHREALADHARQLDWSFLVHHTDRPGEEVLLALHARLSGRPDDQAGAVTSQHENPMRRTASGGGL